MLKEELYKICTYFLKDFSLGLSFLLYHLTNIHTIKMLIICQFDINISHTLLIGTYMQVYLQLKYDNMDKHKINFLQVLQDFVILCKYFQTCFFSQLVASTKLKILSSQRPFTNFCHIIRRQLCALLCLQNPRQLKSKQSQQQE